MTQPRDLEPRRRPDADPRCPWGLYCVAEARWMDAVFVTRQAASEALATLARSASR
ncbi:MAG: hypothetical protein ACRYFW_16120 [Janthinobacterium lividum]